MKSNIGFLQEQQPNGLIANSSMRAMVWLPLVAAIGYLFITIINHQILTLEAMEMLKNHIIDNSAYLAMTATFKAVDYVILNTLLGWSFGSKLYQKAQETKSLKDEQEINAPAEPTPPIQ